MHSTEWFQKQTKMGAFLPHLVEWARKQPGCYHKPSRQFIQLDLWLLLFFPSADVNSITLLLHTIVTSGNSDPKLSKLPGKQPLLYTLELENSDHAALWNNCSDDGRFLHSVFCSLIEST
ncbi:hypothetical protein ACB094_02G047000 [Castanea mollissima]